MGTIEDYLIAKLGVKEYGKLRDSMMRRTTKDK